MTYDALVSALRNGCRIPPGRIDAVLDGCGKTHRELVHELYGSTWSARSGDVCPVCGDRLRVYHSHRAGNRRVRYLRCRSCRYRPPRNKVVLRA